MSDTGKRFLPSHENALRFMELSELVLSARGYQDLAEGLLRVISQMAQSRAVFLYTVDSRLPHSQFFHHGLQPEEASNIRNLCPEQFDRISRHAGSGPVSWPAATPQAPARLLLYPLRMEAGPIGFMGLTAPGDASFALTFPERLLRLITNAANQIAERMKTERQLNHLNIYLTVSSMLAQSLGLHELLEIALNCCMEAVSAETASVLLLDEEKANFVFYHVEGPSKPVLKGATFPADKGLAGSVLQTQKSEVINDVPNDSRFYAQVDSESGFRTRNMIALPLVAGEEKIGVLEILNKANQGSFTEEERLLLLSIAEEIAFAIRNAKVFEYVVNSYCRQRQGQASCKGCKRPLGTWTPCAKYRESAI